MEPLPRNLFLTLNFEVTWPQALTRKVNAELGMQRLFTSGGVAGQLAI
jgi:hypothetical protein